MGRVKCDICEAEIPPHELHSFEGTYFCAQHAKMLHRYIETMKRVYENYAKSDQILDKRAKNHT